MKSKLIIIGAVFAFVSCNNEVKEEDNVPTSKIEVLTSLEETEDTVKKEKEVTPPQENARTMNQAKPLVVARGSEPGWYAEFFKDHLRLLVNNGEDSLHLDHDFSNIANEKIYKAAIVEKSGKTDAAIGITMETKPCTEEASGEKRDRYITIKYKNTLYRGCAYLNK